MLLADPNLRASKAGCPPGSRAASGAQRSSLKESAWGRRACCRGAGHVDHTPPEDRGCHSNISSAFYQSLLLSRQVFWHSLFLLFGVLVCIQGLDKSVRFVLTVGKGLAAEVSHHCVNRAIALTVEVVWQKTLGFNTSSEHDSVARTKEI